MAQGAELGSAVMELTADDSKLVSTVRGAKDKTDGFFGGMLKGAAGVASGILGAQGISAAIGFVKDSVFGLAAAFETEMNVLQQVTGATGADMKMLGVQAKALGADITLPGTSAKDAAEAMTELAKAGLSINDIMGASQGVLQLSAAGQLSNARAAEIAANAINSFGLAGTDATRVADLLAAAANASSVEVVDVADALSNAGAVASSAGVPIEDLVTMISELGNAGIKGGEAGTTLKVMMLALQAPAEKAAGIMKDMGLEVYDASGKMRSMREIIGNLQTSTAGMTQQERDFALSTIFGTHAINAANILLKEGVAGFDDMKEAASQEGAAAAAAAARNKGLAGAMDAIKSSIETVQITIGSLLLPKLADMARGFAGAVSNIEPLAHLFALGFNGGEIGGQFSTIERAVFRAGQVFRNDILPVAREFSDWIQNVAIPALANFATHDVWPKLITISDMFKNDLLPAVREFASVVWPNLETAFGWLADHKEVIVAAVAAFIALKTALLVGGMVQAAVGLGVAFVTMAGEVGIANAAMIMLNLTMLANPFFLVAIAIAALVAAGILLYKNWDTVSAKAQELWDKVKDVFNGLEADVERITGDIGDFLKTHWEGIVTALLAIIFPPGAGLFLIITHWDEIKTKLGEIGDAIKQKLSDDWNQIKSWISDAGGAIKQKLSDDWNQIKDTVGGVMDTIRDTTIEKFNALKDGATEKVQALFSYLGGFASGAADAVGDLGRTLWDKGVALLTGLWEAWDSVNDRFRTMLWNLGGDIAQAVGSLGMTLWSAGKQLIEGLIAGIGNMAVAAKNAAVAVVSDAKDAVLGFLQINSPSKVFMDIGESIPEGMTVGIESGKADTVAAAVDVATAAAQAVGFTATVFGGDITGYWTNLGYGISSGLADGVRAGEGLVSDSFASIVNYYDALTDQVGGSNAALTQEILNTLALYSNDAQQFYNATRAVWGDVTNLMGSTATAVVDGITKTFTNGMGAVTAGTQDAITAAWAMWMDYRAQTKDSQATVLGYWENFSESIAGLSHGLVGTVAEDFSLVSKSFYDLADTTTIAESEMTQQGWDMLAQLNKMWRTYILDTSDSQEQVAGYWKNFGQSVQAIWHGTVGAIGDDMSILQAGMLAGGTASVDGFKAGLAPLIPFLYSVADAVALWGNGVVSSMTDTYKQALAISAAIAAEGAKGAAGTAVLGTASGAAASVSPTAPPPASSAYAQPLSGDAEFDRQVAIGNASNAMNAGIPMAEGGVVRARRGGTLIRAGESGQDEAIVPLGQMGGPINISFDGAYFTGTPQEFKDGMTRVLHDVLAGQRRTAQLHGFIS